MLPPAVLLMMLPPAVLLIILPPAVVVVVPLIVPLVWVLPLIIHPNIVAHEEPPVVPWHGAGSGQWMLL